MLFVSLIEDELYLRVHELLQRWNQSAHSNKMKHKL